MQNPLFLRGFGVPCALKSHLDSPPSFCQSSETGSRFSGGPTSFFHTNVAPPSPPFSVFQVRAPHGNKNGATTVAGPMGFLSPKKNGWRVFTGMRSWVIQLKPVFFCLVQKANNKNGSNFALHVPPFDPKRKHTIKATSTGKVNKTAKRCSTLMNPEIAYWTNTNSSMIFSAQEASNNQSRETSGLLSIFVHLFVILPYVCFRNLFLLLSLDQRFVPSRPSLKEELPPLLRGASARARLRSVSWLHLANLLICVVPQNIKNKMGIGEAKPEGLLSK